jgi:putative transposase
MRTARFLSGGQAGQPNFFHVISRVVDRKLVFGDTEKEIFRKLLRKQLEFAGLREVAWCFMGNHFHLLLEVPDKDDSLAGWTEDDFLHRLELLNSERYTQIVLANVAMWKRNGNAEAVAQVAESVRARLFDLSAFMKEFKQKFTMWFNGTHGRRGTLWEERFKSVLLEDGNAVRTVAAYIDLNPVRAGLCENPEDYRWCSYAAAIAGDVESRRGLASAFRRERWTGKLARDYRLILFGEGQEVSGGVTPRGYVKPRRGFSRERVLAEQKRGGKLALHEALRCRVRYFTSGAVIGSRAFVDEIFERHRDRFGPKRETGARKMRGADWGALTSLRDLREALQ